MTTDKMRRQVWQAMRILRRFTVPDLCRTIPEGDDFLLAIKRIVNNMQRHAIVAKNEFNGGRVGEYQSYRLLRDSGPAFPTVCELCGQPITAKNCDPSKKERERERDKKKEQEVDEGNPEYERLRSLLNQGSQRGQVPEELKKHLEAKYNG